MPYKSVIQSVELKGWQGGLNREADPFLLDVTECPDALNVDFGLRGEVSKRKGYQKYTTDDATSGTGHSLVQWTAQNGVDWLVVVDASGNVFYTSSTVLADSTFGLGAPSGERDYAAPHAAMNYKLYLSRHAAVSPLRFDGSTWTQMPPSNFDGASGVFPRARALVHAHERFFAFNVLTGGGVEYRSRMYFSTVLDPEKWEALDYIDFSPDDGQEITAAVMFGEQIIVFKNRSMFALAGTDATSFVVYPIDEAVGTECPGTVISVGPELYFFDHLTGVWSFDGTGFKKLDDKINKYLLDGINAAAAYKSVAFAYRGRYFLSVPWGSSTVPSRTFVFDGRIGAWTEYDFGVTGNALLGNEHMAVGPREAVGVFKMWQADSDAGANILGHCSTSWLAPAQPSNKHRLRRVDLALSSLGDFDVTVEMRRDFTSDAYVTQQMNTSPGGALWDTAVWDTEKWGTGLSEVLKRLTGWGQRWRVCQFTFRENTTKPFQVNRMVLQISQLGRLRGEP